MSPSSNIASPSKERSTSSKSALSCLCLGTRKRCSAMMPPTSLRTRGMRAEHRFLTLQGSYNRASHRRWSDQLKVPRKSNPSSTIAFSSSASTSPPESETRSCITASRSITIPRFSALRTLAKAPSVVRLRVCCDLAAIPVLSFSGERVGEVPLDLKSATLETARAVVHRGLVAKQQNQRCDTASILTTADLSYSTALQGATIRSQPLFSSSLWSCSHIFVLSTKHSILSSVFIKTKALPCHTIDSLVAAAARPISRNRGSGLWLTPLSSCCHTKLEVFGCYLPINLCCCVCQTHCCLVHGDNLLPGCTIMPCSCGISVVISTR
ncbi:hypothetical protein BHE74_00044843 [Ensete ventricosum]|nr:hypothetical protein BHE74_00044843 [Ensete ventricosum]